MSGNTGGCTRSVCRQCEVEDMGHDSQIRGTIGTSRATLSGITTRMAETVAHCRTISIPSTSVCLDPSSKFGLRVLINLAGIPANNFVEMIRFFSTLILNADESRQI
jgi:hypothetical protein